MRRPRTSLLVALPLAAACAGPARPSDAALSALPTPNAAQLAWQQAELGVVFHYDLHLFDDEPYVQARNRRRPPVDPARFRPEHLDTDQWVAAAAAAGARFAILTASHETGFRLWQSDANPFCLRAATEWGDGDRDIVAEFHASCVRHGLRPGVYLGTRWNARLGVLDFRVTERSPLGQDEYNRLIEQEVEEICTRYGPWFEFWFDGGAHGPDQGGPDVLAIVERHQPDAVFYHSLQRADARWGGSESGTVPYPCWASFPYPVTGAGESARPEIAADGFALLKHGDPGGAHWLPAMSDAPIRGRGAHLWFCEPGTDGTLRTVAELVDMYCRSVGHNSTLILGLTPDASGLLPDAEVERLEGLGRALQALLGDPVARTAAPTDGDVARLDLPAGARVGTVVLQEDVRHGERVRRHVLEVLREGSWRSLVEGSCIGHKRIVCLEAPVTGEALRLRA